MSLSSLTWTPKDPTTAGPGTSLQPKDVSNSFGRIYDHSGNAVNTASTGAGPWVSAVYEPSTDLVYRVEGGYGDGNLVTLWSYKASTNTYTQLTNSMLFALNGTIVLDSKRHRIYVFGNQDGPTMGDAATQMGTPRITYTDVTAGGSFASTNVTATAAGTCNAVAGALSPGAAYSPVLDKIVLWPNFGNTVYLYDPVLGTCTTRTYAGGPPDSLNAGQVQQTDGTLGRFAYMPNADAFLVCNDADTNCYTLQLALGNSAPTISTTTLANGNKGTAYSASITAIGSPAPTLSVTSGSLPAGLTLNGNVISGTPTQVGSSTFTITAANGTAPNATQAYTVRINGSLSTALTIQETLYSGGSTGVARTNEPFCLGVPIPDSEAIRDTTGLGLTGATSAQFRILGSWPSGNAQWIKACGVVASMTAGGTATVTFTDTGTGNSGAGMATNGATITVATGAATFTVKKANFNGLDIVDVGSTHLVLTGASSGVVLLGPDGAATYPANVTCSTDGADHANVSSVCNRVYTSALDGSSTVSIEEDGPVLTVLKATGDLKDAGGHTYMHHTTRLYFYKGKTGVKVQVILRNADHGASSTFASATKGFQALEFRVTTNLSGTLTYSLANHTGTPTSGTLTNYAYLYQAESSVMKQVTCAGPTSTGTCVLPSPLTGYAIISNGSAAQTGTAAQIPQGWGDISDASGVGVEIGQYQLGAYGNKSLEFQSGGNDVRIGLWAGQNNTTSTSTLTANKPYYQKWPQWNVQEGWLNFHATTPASLPNAFLSYQHYLVGHGNYTAYNAANVFPFPLLDPTEESNYYAALDAAQPPAVTKPAFEDMGLTRTYPTQYWLNVWRYWEWETGGGQNQMEFHRARLYNFIRRGWTGGFLDTAHFYKFTIEQAYPMSDGFNWRSFTGEVDGSADPTATSANSSLTTANWEQKYEHNHTNGLPFYYFMTGDEWIKDGIVEGAKDHFLSTATVIDSGRLWNPRAIGNTLKWEASLYNFLSAIGDSDASLALTQGQKAYTNQVRPDLCVNVPGGTSPAGCTVGVVGGTGTAQRGTSKLRGMNYPWGESIGQTGCTPGSGRRDAATYQHGMLIDGLLEFRRAYGSGWQYYNESFDLAYGIAKWSQSEMYVSGASWGTSGSRYYEAIDYANACDTTDYFPVKNLNSAWQQYKVLGLYEGGNSWKSRLDRTLQKFISDGSTEEMYLYTMQDAIYMALHPSTVLNPLSFTFADLGSGSYNLSWTVPTGATSYRIKWSPKQIVDLIGFNAGTNAWIGDPLTTANWFAATDAANIPAPSGSTQSLTINTGATGLLAANFAVKAYGGTLVATAPTVTTTSPIPSGTVGVAYSQTLTATGDTPITWDISAGTLTACNLTLSSAGLVSGTPASATTCGFTARATNAAGNNTKALSVTINTAVVAYPVRRRMVAAAKSYMTSAYVQGKQNAACAGGNAACAVTLDAPLTVAADHVVILAVQSDSATTSPGAVTDGAGTTNSYTAVAPFFGGNGLGVTIFCAPVTTANTVIAVAGKTAEALSRIEAAEFSGMTCTPDGSPVTGTNAASTNPVTSTGITPSQTDLILATVFDYGGNTSLTAGPGFTTDTTNLRTAYGMLQYALNRSTAITPAAVQSQTSFWAMAGVALKNHAQ